MRMDDTFGDVMFFFRKTGLLFVSCHCCLAFPKAEGWEADFLSLSLSLSGASKALFAWFMQGKTHQDAHSKTPVHCGCLVSTAVI